LGDEAQRIAANITKLPELNARRSGLFRKRMSLGGESAAKFAQEKSPGIPAEA